MKTIRKLKWIFVLIGLCGAKMANAQPWDQIPSHGNYTLNSDMLLSYSIKLDGDLTITATGNYTIYKAWAYTPGDVVPGIEEGQDSRSITHMFITNGYNLTIKGVNGGRVTLDGGAMFIDGDAKKGLKDNKFNASKRPNIDLKAGDIIHVTGLSSVELENVTLQNCFNASATVNNADGSGTHSVVVQGTGAGVNTNSVSHTGTRKLVKLTNCEIKACYGSQGAAINCDGQNEILVTNVSMHHCYSPGGSGTIGTGGGAKAILTLDNCQIYENEARLWGGGLSWYAGGRDDAKMTIKGNTKIHHNKAGYAGGGLYGSGKIDILSAEIYNNTVTGDHPYLDDDLYVQGLGGGIYIYPYSGPGETFAGGLQFTMETGVSVHDNTAYNKGGGICVEVLASDFAPFKKTKLYGSNQVEFWPLYDEGPLPGEQGYVMNSGKSFTIIDVKIKDGGQIYNNTAEQGGGLCILDYSPKWHQCTRKAHENEPTKWSGILKRIVTVEGGEIKNNHSLSQNYTYEPNEYYGGGGVYIYKGPRLNGPHTTAMHPAFAYDYGYAVSGDGVIGNYVNNWGSGDINITMSGGEIISNSTVASNGKESYGGGVYVNDDFKALGLPVYSKCNVGISGSVQINNNQSTTHGGGLFVNYGTVTVNGGAIGKEGFPNKALNGNGGGLAVQGGTVTIQSGTITHNKAGQNGGGFYVDVTNNTDTTFIKGGAVVSYNKAVNGGGAYIKKGHLRIDNNATTINANKASTAGGGIYMVSGTVLFNDATMQADTAQYGGGFYLGNGEVIIDGATISNNVSTVGHGGAFDIANGNLTVGNSSITGNKAPAGNGGGAYVGNGNVEFNAGTTVTYNTAINGGGLYVGDGSITYNNGEISHNTATGDGGGIYANSDVGFVGGTVSNNVAVNGGGLYSASGTVDFSSGTFDSNSATGNGGGIYVANGATVLLSGTATLTKNHVPYANGENIGHGGGIYLGGTVKVGRNANDPQGTHSLNVQDNYQDTESNLNNIYLAGDNKVIELLSDMRNSSTKLGFSVNSGFRKVVYHAGDATDETGSWLHGLLTEGGTQGLTGVIFDDSRKYMAVHVLSTTDETFDHEYIYLWGCWISAVDKDPQAHLDEYPLPTGVANHYTKDTDGTWHIWTKEGLAWFSSFVNGLNAYSTDYSESVNAAAKAVMEADVDMNEYLWVPLGSAASFDPTSTDPTSAIFTDGHKFKGEFDGKGHIIRGLDCRYINSIHNYGLFGETFGNANITNTFVDAFRFDSNQETGAYQMGGIAGTASGNTVIANCEARGTMTAPNSDVAVLGSVVGVLDGNATVHSSIGLADMSGKAAHMGGLVGLVKSNAKLANSYSNATYSPVATSSAKIGALAGTNFGTIENCYVISLRGTTPSNFQWFAGSNNGTIDYCYAPTEATGVQTGTNGNYATTQLVNGKYGYAHRDQEVTATNDYVENAIGNDGELKGLLATLNNWVEDQTDGVGYSTWTRTMASPINDDLPVLEFDDFVSAGSTDNIFIAYKDDLNDMIDYANANSTGGSVYLYDATPTAVNKSTNGNVRVYIDPNVGITQADGNTLNARVGVALDNSSTDFMAYDWHMFSSALQAAPMGLVYHSDEGTYYVRDNYATLSAQGITHTDYTDVTKMDPPMTTWNTTPGQIGYFPTDAPYGPWRNTGSLSQGFDFYCFHEPSRHWINFKREGREGFYDHWNQYVYNPATDRHTQIEYPNESAMVSGKGYMVALSQPSMMMADGVLNNTATQSSNASYNEGSGYDQPLRGLNLVGNPYQSYLDFNQFANTNGIDTYYILDADAKGYIAYTSGSTPQQSEWIGGLKRYTTTRYIHPHQGFFVWVDAAQTITFNSDMRKGGTNTSSVGSDYRDWEPRYALVNMVCTDGEGRNDFATIELDRPEQGGGRKAKGLRSGDASIWFRLGEEDYQIAFAPVGTQSAALRFEAHTDGAYTLRWNMQNADFGYLHLIDNLTGADIDCLTTDEYRFEAKTSDYTSRFRLVFEFTGVEENDEPTEGPTSFAFMMGDELVINGEGVLQMFDLNGRQLLSTEIHGTQATVAMPKVADGLYVLRLTNGNQVRTQKMVINK